MNIAIVRSDTEIAACYPVMSELRPHIAEGEFVERVRRLEEDGYRLVCLWQDGVPQAVAGIRTGENLAWGRFLYVDDLVTAPAQRSKGHGARLLAWIREYAAKQGCAQLHLDSGLQRLDAHRFYEREGVAKFGFHFAEILAFGNASGR
ncbi:MAG: GNAT family N-acetyltransferase [Candidatus Thiodiazotropha sp.]